MDNEKSSFFDNHSAEELLIYFFVILIVIVFVILLIPRKEGNPSNPIQNKQNNDVVIKLVGDNPYHLLKGKTYEEPGYEAFDSLNNNISQRIVVSGKVDINTPGKYEITYRVDNVESKRIVIVSNMEPKFIDEEEDFINDSHTIMLLVNGNDYDKTILPDNTETTSRGIEFEADQNGTYPFVIYDQYGNQIRLERKIEKIDKTAPDGTCTNKLDLGKTYVEVKATDSQSGISAYTYNNGEKQNTSSNPKYEYSGLYKEVQVTLIDKVGNKKTIKCVSSGEGATAQIKPPAGANIIKSADSDTLKVSIEKKSGYYITRIWVVDPYNQINKGLILENWNKKRARASNIINHEISSRGLNNKIVVGINGSGFYENGTWTPGCSSSSYKNQYNRTTEGPLVIYDGKVVRNWYQDGAVDKSRNHSIYTISKEGYFDTYQNFNGLAEAERQKFFNNIVSKGYRNTWTFRPVAILNGTILTTNLVGEQMKNRNVVCQIDRNNWAILTGQTTAKDAVNILKNMGCKTAVNMDGSGSVSLHFKAKNGTLETLHGGGRDVVDTLYITEK